MPLVTILMYHYVRDIRRSRFPRLKGLSVELFEHQLRYVMNYYEVIKMEDLFDALSGKRTIPNNSLLLTFDDGYKDHFDYVFPRLRKLGVQGSFFPPAKALLEHAVLDVNKIHFILASVEDTAVLIRDVYALLDKHRANYALASNDSYYRSLAVKSRFDTAEVIFIKRLLQRELPEQLRTSIVDELFFNYVSKESASFSKELYMDTDQLKQMRKQGMYIGSHGWDHYWLNALSPSQQAREIERSLHFLKGIGSDVSRWTMAYPYGAYNDSLLSLMKKHGGTVGLTTEVRVADLSVDVPLALPRLDTNDLPQAAGAEANEWTRKVCTAAS